MNYSESKFPNQLPRVNSPYCGNKLGIEKMMDVEGYIKFDIVHPSKSYEKIYIDSPVFMHDLKVDIY